MAGCWPIAFAGSPVAEELAQHRRLSLAQVLCSKISRGAPDHSAAPKSNMAGATITIVSDLVGTAVPEEPMFEDSPANPVSQTVGRSTSW